MSERHTFKIGETVEVGPARVLGGLSHERLYSDAHTGQRGVIGRYSCGEYEILRQPGSALWVFRDRLRPVQPNGFALPSYNDHTFGGHP